MYHLSFTKKNNKKKTFYFFTFTHSADPSVEFSRRTNNLIKKYIYFPYLFILNCRLHL